MMKKNNQVVQVRSDTFMDRYIEHKAREILSLGANGEKVQDNEYNSKLNTVREVLRTLADHTNNPRPVPSEGSKNMIEALNQKYARWLAENKYQSFNQATETGIPERVETFSNSLLLLIDTFMGSGLSIEKIRNLAEKQYDVFEKVSSKLQAQIGKKDLDLIELMSDFSEFLAKTNGNMTHRANVTTGIAAERITRVLNAWILLMKIRYGDDLINPAQLLINSEFFCYELKYKDEIQECFAINHPDKEVRKYAALHVLMNELLDQLQDACNKISVGLYPVTGFLNFFSINTLFEIRKELEIFSKLPTPNNLFLLSHDGKESAILDLSNFTQALSAVDEFFKLSLRSKAMIEIKKPIQYATAIFKIFDSENYLDEKKLDEVFHLNLKIAENLSEFNGVESPEVILALFYAQFCSLYSLVAITDDRRFKRLDTTKIESSQVIVDSLYKYLDPKLSYDTLPKELILRYVQIAFTLCLSFLTLYSKILTTKEKDESQKLTAIRSSKDIFGAVEFMRNFCTQLKHTYPITTIRTLMMAPSDWASKVVPIVSKRTIFQPDHEGNLYLTPEIYNYFQNVKQEIIEIESQLSIKTAEREEKKAQKKAKYKSQLASYSIKKQEIDKVAEEEAAKASKVLEYEEESKRVKKERKLQKAFKPRIQRDSKVASSSTDGPKLTAMQTKFKEALDLRISGEFEKANNILYFISFESPIKENIEVIIYSLLYLGIDYARQTTSIAKLSKKVLDIKPNKISDAINLTRKADEIGIIQNNLTVVFEKVFEVLSEVRKCNDFEEHDIQKIQSHIYEFVTQIREDMKIACNQFSKICFEIDENRRRFREQFPEIYYRGNPDNPSVYSLMQQSVKNAFSVVKESSEEIDNIRKKQSHVKSRDIFSFIKKTVPTEVKDDFEIGLSPKSISIMNKTSRLNPRHAEFFFNLRNKESKQICK